MSSGTFATGEFFSETQVISAAQSKRHLEDKNAPGFRRSPITHKINVLPKILLIFWVCRGVVGGFFFKKKKNSVSLGRWYRMSQFPQIKPFISPGFE